MSMRTYGLSGSGLDVDQLVSDLIKAKRVPRDKIYQQKTKTEWKKADYNAMYTELNNFWSVAGANKLQSTLAPKKASSSTESVAAATATADATSTNHTLEITSLADGVKKTSSASITTGASKDSLNNQFGIDQTLGASFTLKITNGSLSKEITVDPTKSIYELVSSINSGTNINVKANYDATLDRFFLYTTDTGASSGIDFAGSSAEGLNFLQNDLLLNTNAQNGTNAVIKLDNVDLTPASNTLTVSGVTYSLKNAGTTNISVNADIDKAVTNIKSFIDSYNATLSKINGELNEAVYKSYQPLTTEEKKELGESQIKDWETFAKSGMLRRDPTLTDAMSRLRRDMSNPIEGLTGNYQSAASIGVTTGDYTENGKLYLDETKLRTALNDDPDIAYKIFGTDASSASADGISVRLQDSIKVILNKLKAKAGVASSAGSTTLYDSSELGKSIASYQKRISELDDRIEQAQTRYYRQFDAMEQAINRLNSQAGWLSQQLG